MTTTVYMAGPIKETDDPHSWREQLQQDAHEDIVKLIVALVDTVPFYAITEVNGTPSIE